jgi:GntR family transcriptional repressor for pyruvate dehydrogenase complex
MEDYQNQDKSYKRVIEYIKDRIKLGEITIGQKIPSERELSETLGISRNSVREAIRTLDFMGIISSQQGAGNYMTGNLQSNLVESMSMLFLLDQIDYKQISELRRGLELEALNIAIDKITQEEIEEFQQILDKLENCSEDDNIILDKKLHYGIASVSGNLLIISILNALSEVMDQFIADLRRDILVSESREKLHIAHRDIVESLRTGDKELGTHAIDMHFNAIDERLKK